MNPAATIILQVLYLFAGLARKADLSACLLALVNEFNRSSSFAFRVELKVEEVDILRGGSAHDLTDKARRDALLQRVLANEFGIAIATFPCSNHTMVVFSNAQGPRPTRDCFHPEGFLNLSPWEMKKT